MVNHAKRNLRALVASAIFAAVLGLGSGTASATPFLADFQAPRPFTAGNMPTNFDDTTNITGDVFDFTFTGGGDFTIAGGQGESSSDGIFATSIPVDGGDEFVTIILDGGGTFFFVSIFIDSFGPDMFLEGILGGVLQYSTTVGAGSGVEPSGDNAQLVDTVRLRSADFDSLVFDSFRGEFAMGPMPMPMPEPGTLALFVIGLFGLGLLSRRRRRSA